MFERFDEHARRSVFFARYEASRFGSRYIEAPHLLLGILRENTPLRNHLGEQALAAVRQRLETGLPQRESISTSLDVPLSRECKSVLSHAADEAERMGHLQITCDHLTLGLYRVGGPVAETLADYGISPEKYGPVVQASMPQERELEVIDQTEAPSADFAEPAAPALAPVVGSLRNLMEKALAHIEHDDAYGARPLKRQPWTRAEALGHLIDSATAHRLWILRALTETKVTAAGYPSPEWVTAQQYAKVPWEDLVEHWQSLNRMMMNSLLVFPAERVNTPIRIGLDEPLPLLQLLERYVEQVGDWIGQITARL